MLGAFLPSAAEVRLLADVEGVTIAVSDVEEEGSPAKPAADRCPIMHQCHVSSCAVSGFGQTLQGTLGWQPVLGVDGLQ